MIDWLIKVSFTNEWFIMTIFRDRTVRDVEVLSVLSDDSAVSFDVLPVLLESCSSITHAQYGLLQTLKWLFNSKIHLHREQ